MTEGPLANNLATIRAWYYTRMIVLARSIVHGSIIAELRLIIHRAALHP